MTVILIFHSATMNYILIFFVIVLNVSILRMFVLFLSSYCGVCLPLHVCRPPGRVSLVYLVLDNKEDELYQLLVLMSHSARGTTEFLTRITEI
jgi:hypothetical protein